MSTQLQDSLGMFALLAVELSALFIGISLIVGVLQRHIPQSRIETLLSSRGIRGYVLAAVLGAVTPFCSCSTVPMLKGFIKARAGFGPMMVFLFSSPLLNPIVIALLSTTFGFKLTALYVCASFGVSLCAGWLLNKLGFDRYVRQTATQRSNKCLPLAPPCEPTISTTNSQVISSSLASNTSCCERELNSDSASSGCSSQKSNRTFSRQSKYKGLWQEAWSDYLGVLPYLLIGIAIGSIIYGFMPTGILATYAGSDNPLAIPVAAIVGVPLYIRATTVIPIAEALMAKGVGAGTVLALIIGSAGASLTELILLRSLFKIELLSAFVAVVFAMAIIGGYAKYLFF